MTKLKSSKSLKKRFSLTAKGKIKYTKAGRRHLLEKKSSRHKRRLRERGIVSKGDLKRIKRLLICS